MAFDPNQFLQETAPAKPAGGFDPNEFLQSTGPQTMGGQAKEAVGAAFGQTMDALKTTATAPWALADSLRKDPKALNKKVGPWLPAAGGVIGSAFAPGIGTAIGAGAGQMLKQMGDIAFEEPGRVLAGSNFSPRAGLEAAGQALAAGAGEVNGIIKAAPGAAPYLQRGIDAAGKALAPVGQGIKSGIAKVSQAFTGAPARNAMQVMDQPSTLVTTIGQVGKLGKAVEGAEAGLSSKLTPELEAAITTNKGGIADDIVTNLMSQARTNAESITTHDAIAGIKAIDRTLPAPTRSNSQVLQKYYDLRSTLADIVSKDEPAYAAAKGAYSEAKGASAMRNIFPRTMTGNVSTVKTVLPMLLDWKRAAALPVTSPIVHGVAMAAGSTAAKAAGFAISNPTARQALISRFVESRYDGSGGTNDH